MLKIEKSKVVETIRNRRSIKKFKSTSIDPDMIIDLLNDAVWAPNHGVREPWRFMLFMDEGKETIVEALQNEEQRGKLSTKNPEKLIERYRHIPAHLVVVMEESDKKKSVGGGFCSDKCINSKPTTAWLGERARNDMEDQSVHKFQLVL
ncbi:nitroreductase family protein [Halobacillus andaensis]|uniref:nitroreductase family protein n=1 Tax=Halobacillus andaensis TaxID=1176239 RepID=UPI003D719BA0